MSIQIDQNDDEILDVTVKKANGDAADLASCQLFFAMRPSKGSSIIVLQKSTVDGIVISTPTTDGTAEITIDGADTADFETKYLDRDLVWQLDAIDSTNKRVTLATGLITVARDLVP